MKSRTAKFVVVAMLMALVCLTVQVQSAKAVWLWGVPFPPGVIEPVPWIVIISYGYLAAQYVWSFYNAPANQAYLTSYWMNYYASGGW